MLHVPPQRVVAPRVCLRCNTTFPSKGPGNRICPKCSKVNARYGPIPEEIMQLMRGVKRHNGEVIMDSTE